MKPARCWLKSHWWAPLILVVLVGIISWAVWSSVRIVDNKHHDDATRAQARAASEQSRRYLCERANELPGKIAQLLAIGDQIRQLATPTTTIAPRADLTPEEKAHLASLLSQQQQLVRDLARQDDCDKVVAGQVTNDTSTTKP